MRAWMIPLLLSLSAMACSHEAFAATEEEFVVDQGLADKQPRSYTQVRPLGDKFSYSLSARGRDGKWGVVRTRYKADASRREDPGRAEWLLEPEFDDVFIARSDREVGHFWVKPPGDAGWQVYRTDGRSATALGSTPYQRIGPLLEGGESPFSHLLAAPAAGGRMALRQHLLAVSTDAGSGVSTAALIDPASNAVLLEIDNIDDGKPLIYSGAAIAIPHAGAAGGYTVIKPQPRPVHTQPPETPEVIGFYLDLEWRDGFACGVDSLGHWTLLDRDFRPFQVDALALGKPLPLALAGSGKSGPVMKVAVVEASGEGGFRLLYRDRSGNPSLVAGTWKELFEDDHGYLIGHSREGHWELLSLVHSVGMVTAYPQSFDIARRQVVRAPTLAELYPVIGNWQRDQDEKRQRHAADTAAWLATEPERRRQYLSDLQKRIDAHAKARAEAEAAARKAAEQAAREFAARNQSAWSNLPNLTLPRIRGAPGLSALEQDYYVGRGYVKVPAGTPGARFR